MKKLLTLALVLVMTMSLAAIACADATTITAWISDGAESVVYQEMFDDFNAKHEGEIVVDDQYFAQDELLNKLQTAPIVGDAPEVIIIDGLQIPYFQDLDMIACLDDYIPEEMKSDVIPSVWAENTYDGSIYGVAQFDSGMGMWTRRSILEKIGARIPTSYKEAWTVEEFEDILAKCKEAGYEYPLYIRQNKVTSLYFNWMPVIASFGGDFLNRDTMTATGTLDGENTIAAYDWMKKMLDAGYINPACDYEDAFFGREEAAFSVLGHWKYSDHVGAFGDDAIIVPIPDFGGGVFTCSGSTVDVMTTAAIERGKGDAAWTVLEAIMSPEYIQMVCNVNGGVPSRASVMDSMEQWQEGGRLYLYREQLEAGISYLRPITPAHSTVYNAVADVCTNIIAGGDPAEELHEAAEYVDEIIYENGWNIE